MCYGAHKVGISLVNQAKICRFCYFFIAINKIHHELRYVSLNLKSAVILASNAS